MTTDSGPHSLDRMRLILDPAGRSTLKVVSDTFYQELDAEFPDFSGHVLIQQFSFDAPWGTWEVHPEGDEFVFLLEGDTDLILHQDGEERVVRISEPGSYVVVPQGTWHTARPHAPSTMLFVTPGEGTLNAEAPPAA